jgi:ABC-2 type transport system ATP-binding protein
MMDSGVMTSAAAQRFGMTSVDRKTAEELNADYAVCNLKNDQDKVILRIVSNKKPHIDAVNVIPNMEDMYLYYFADVSNNQGNGGQLI